MKRILITLSIISMILVGSLGTVSCSYTSLDDCPLDVTYGIYNEGNEVYLALDFTNTGKKTIKNIEIVFYHSVLLNDGKSQSGRTGEKIFHYGERLKGGETYEYSYLVFRDTADLFAVEFSGDLYITWIDYSLFGGQWGEPTLGKPMNTEKAFHVNLDSVIKT